MTKKYLMALIGKKIYGASNWKSGMVCKTYIVYFTLDSLSYYSSVGVDLLLL